MSKVTAQPRGKSAPAKAPAVAPKRSKTGDRVPPLNPTIKNRNLKAAKAVDEAFSVFQPASVRTKTLRLEPVLERGLVMLKEVQKKPINKMVNEAVGEYIQRRTAQVEAELTATLEQLQAYRLADPEFLAARQAFIEGEALYGKDDPMEGRIVRVKASAGAAKRQESNMAKERTAKAGPALTKVRELLRG